MCEETINNNQEGFQEVAEKRREEKRRLEHKEKSKVTLPCTITQGP